MAANFLLLQLTETHSSAGGNHLALRFEATRDQRFQAFPVVAYLADRSDGGKVTIQITAVSGDGFDPIWRRNAEVAGYCSRYAAVAGKLAFVAGSFRQVRLLPDHERSTELCVFGICSLGDSFSPFRSPCVVRI